MQIAKLFYCNTYIIYYFMQIAIKFLSIFTELKINCLTLQSIEIGVSLDLHGKFFK